jgi:hypothetical protein
LPNDGRPEVCRAAREKNRKPSGRQFFALQTPGKNRIIVFFYDFFNEKS